MKSTTGNVIRKKPSKYLVAYLDAQGVILDPDEIKDTSEEGNKGVIGFDEFVAKTANIGKEVENKQEKEEIKEDVTAVEKDKVQVSTPAASANKEPEAPKNTVITATETLEDLSSGDSEGSQVETLNFE